MTREEALLTNRVLLALLAQKRTLSMVGIGIGMTEYDGELLAAMEQLSGAAHKRLECGLSAETVTRAYRNPRELWDVMEQIRKEDMAQCA